MVDRKYNLKFGRRFEKILKGFKGTTMRFLQRWSRFVAVAVFFVGASANAGFHFTQAELLSMELVAAPSQGYVFSYGPNLAPQFNYADGDPTMTGLAGLTGNLNANPNPPGIQPAHVFFSLADKGLGQDFLTQFKSNFAGSGESILDMYSFNDNNQAWEVGIWYSVDNLATIVESTEGGLVPGQHNESNPPVWWALTTLDFGAVNINDITHVGVFVRNQLQIVNPTGSWNDDFHASWGIEPPGNTVPEPMSLVVWSGLLSVAIVGGVLRRCRSSH